MLKNSTSVLIVALSLIYIRAGVSLQAGLEDTLSKTIILPESEDMLQRLRNVYSTGGREEGFYHLLLAKKSEQPVNGGGVVLWLCLALDEYKQISITNAVIGIYLPEFIDALIDDSEVREAAHARMKLAYPSLYPSK